VAAGGGLIMLRYLIDPANAITGAGLMFAVLGLFAALSGHLELGLAAVVWALLADHLDGIVASRLRNRDPVKGQIGKHLDSFTDLVSDAVFPALLIMQLNERSVASLVLAMFVLLAGALRLSYFNSFGLTNGRFIGVPLSYDIPVLAVLFVARPWLPPESFVVLINAVMLTLAVLHVLTIQVPRATGAALVSIVAVSIAASVVLASRTLA
jgi:CDP-diacylglycerol--serine O-phosphatidyltransferase